MVNRFIEKITVFVTRQTSSGYQLLLLEHPFAGIQIPAGTVNASETPLEAAIRETYEETGLMIPSQPVSIGFQESKLEQDEAIILPPATVYARPDISSFDWINIRSAVKVMILRNVEKFTQISYIEYDQIPHTNYVSMHIKGWILDENLARVCKRYFYHNHLEGVTQGKWKITNEHHTFSVFWSPLNDLPGIIPPQDDWLVYLSSITDDEEYNGNRLQ